MNILTEYSDVFLSAIAAGVGFGLVYAWYGGSNWKRQAFFGFVIWALYLIPGRILAVLDGTHTLESALVTTIRWALFIFTASVVTAIMDRRNEARRGSSDSLRE